jgi:6-phosphogluconolactonase
LASVNARLETSVNSSDDEATHVSDEANVARSPTRMMAFTATQRCRWRALADRRTLDRAVATSILAAADRAIRARGQFHFVLAGGDTPRGTYRRMCEASADWSGWHIYFGDERCLPADDPERNSRMAGEAWLDHASIPTAQVHAIPVELGAIGAARLYGETLHAVGEFDLVLLGLGEDGHTASLFPGHEWGTAPGSPDALAVFDAPKPPLQRVTLSAARLSRARQVMFMVSGEAKHRAVVDWRAGKDIPARAITPVAGVDVLVDSALLLPLND